MDYGVSNDQRPDITRLNLMPDNEKENNKGSSKLPGIPGRNKQGQNGQGAGKDGRSNRPRIPPWVIAVLFLGLVAYQLYAIFDPQRDSQSITVPYSVVEQQVSSGNVAQVTLTDETITAELKAPVAWNRATEQLVTPRRTQRPRAWSKGIACAPRCRQLRTPGCCRC